MLKNILKLLQLIRSFWHFQPFFPTSFSFHSTLSTCQNNFLFLHFFLFLIFYSIDYVCHNKLPFIPSRHASSYLFSHPFTLSLTLDLILMPLKCQPVDFLFIHTCHLQQYESELLNQLFYRLACSHINYQWAIKI